MENPTRLREPLGTLPVEYWEMDASIYGALADNLSACGVLMLSIRDMPVGTRLYVRIFYANEYELYWITAEASIVSKDRHITEDWKGHKYQLQFVQMSEGNRLKLKDLLNNHSMLEHNPGVQDRAADGSSQGETVLPTFPESDVKVLQPSHCRSYENGKCLKTHAFCDLCQTADEIIVLEMARSAQKSRSRRSKPFTSGLARLAGNFKSAFGNY
jgi:hypothetical protein